MATVGNRAQTSGKLLLVDKPVAKSCMVIVACAEPAVVKHEGVDPETFDAVDGIEQTVAVKSEVHSLPAVKHNGTACVYPARVYHVFSEKVMIMACHCAESLSAVTENGFGSFKAFAAAKLPIKAFGIYTH